MENEKSESESGQMQPTQGEKISEKIHGKWTNATNLK